MANDLELEYWNEDAERINAMCDAAAQRGTVVDVRQGSSPKLTKGGALADQPTNNQDEEAPMGVDMQDKANQRKLAKALIPYSNDQEALNRLTMYLSVTLKEMDDLDDALAVAVEELENDVNSGETEKSSRPRGQ